MGVDKWQNVAMQSEIDELRARYVELKQVNSELATASIIPEGYQLVPIENIQYSVDWGTNGDRTCVSIVKKHSDGHLEVVAAAYEPRKGKKS